MIDGMDLANHCIAFGQKLGAQYVEARYVKEETRGFVYRNGAPIGGGRQPQAGIGVRVLVNGSLGFASIDRVEQT